jgi:cytochrome P450
MITPTFHFKILNSFVEVYSENSETLIRKLQKEVGTQEFDVLPYVYRCTLDIICGEYVNKADDIEIYCSLAYFEKCAKHEKKRNF